MQRMVTFIRQERRCKVPGEESSNGSLISDRCLRIEIGADVFTIWTAHDLLAGLSALSIRIMPAV